jgi:DNA-binding NarL/FixJ family response regulator
MLLYYRSYPRQQRKALALTVGGAGWLVFQLFIAFNTSAMLEELGHTVFAAASGPRALEILRHEDSIDLLITDQAMPGMTGSELAATIRTESPTCPSCLAAALLLQGDLRVVGGVGHSALNGFIKRRIGPICDLW